MNTQEENTNLEEIRKMWQEINIRLARLEEQTVNVGKQVADRRITSAQEDLANKYKRLAMVAFPCGFLFAFIYGNPNGVFQYPSLKYQILVGAALLIFFCIAGIMDLYLCHGVKDIDVARMSVTEVRRLAIKLRKTHHIFQMILIPMAIGLLLLMIYPIFTEIWIGALIGLIIGLSFGISIYLKMMKDYRALIDS